VWASDLKLVGSPDPSYSYKIGVIIKREKEKKEKRYDLGMSTVNCPPVMQPRTVPSPCKCRGTLI